jgi:predicted Zn finger-like uncharacterized protein
MLTCCPKCGTTFRVSPQQLKVHRGEVRCGRCSTVFDAFDSLLAEPSEAGITAEADSTAPATLAAPTANESVAQSSQAPVFAASPASEDGLVERRREMREMLPDSEQTSAVAGVTTGASSDRFGNKRRAGPRWPWILLTLIAVLALALQASYRFRAEMAATWPDSRPWLERACAELRCVVSLPRHIELVSIDASDLQVDTAHSNLMLLTATLKNRAPFAQEHPALALTLTDTQDQPLARRVLAPADYLERKTDGKAGFAPNAEYALKMYIDSREVKATGYRLFLFYP